MEGGATRRRGAAPRPAAPRPAPRGHPAGPAFALGRAQVSRGQDAAEPAVSRAVLRIDEHVRRAVVEGEPRAGNDARRAHRLRVLARKNMRAHDAGERVAIRDPDSREPKFGGARDHLLGMRGPAQKRKIRHRRQFGELRLEPDHPLPSPASGRRWTRAARPDEGKRTLHHGKPHVAAIVASTLSRAVRMSRLLKRKIL